MNSRCLSGHQVLLNSYHKKKLHQCEQSCLVRSLGVTVTVTMKKLITENRCLVWSLGRTVKVTVKKHHHCEQLSVWSVSLT